MKRSTMVSAGRRTAHSRRSQLTLEVLEPRVLLSSPTIEYLYAWTDTSVVPPNVELDAQGVNDFDGTVVKVQFWRDANGNAVFDLATDQLLGVDTNGADGWTRTASTAGWGSGIQTLFARAQNNFGTWGVEVSTQLEFGVPSIGWLNAAANTSSSPATLDLTAENVSDTDGNVVSVSFWRDENANYDLDLGTDLLLGTDTNGANGWSVNCSVAAWPPGTYTFLARAQDNSGNFSQVEYTSLQLGGVTIGSLGAVGNTDLTSVTLTASDVISWAGQVTSVQFWRDTSGDGILDPGVDQLLGTDSSSTGGWSLTVSAAGWTSGSHTLFARAQDSLSNVSDPAETYWSNVPDMSNPNWEIFPTDYGYADLLYDRTPGFEGREYLSGEWGAAVSYTRSASGPVAPTWLEPNFSYPSWTTNSTFSVVSPLTFIGRNSDGLPIFQSVINNTDVRITITYEMLDTVFGTPMGLRPASSALPGNSVNSNRYVLQQTYDIRNVSTETISNLRLYQLLHGLHSDEAAYDNRSYTGPMQDYRYDITLRGVDESAGSGSTNLDDLIGFHSRIAPLAWETGSYGLESVDSHSYGKPSVGVHVSIENNNLNNSDYYLPPEPWVAGGQAWGLGALAPSASTSFDVILTILTGTRIDETGTAQGIANGGGDAPGGVSYSFSNVTTQGTIFASYAAADAAEVTQRVAAGQFTQPAFDLPNDILQFWTADFSGAFSGGAALTFGYDSSLLPTGFDENTLVLYQYVGGAWTALAGTVDPVAHNLAVNVTSLGIFALGSSTSTVPITEVRVARGDDRGFPATGDEERTYSLDVAGVELTGLQVTTPWGEAFDVATYLPPGWAGETFQAYDDPNNIAVKGYTAGTERWFEVDWEELAAGEWTALGTTAANVTATCTEGTWSGTVNFTGAAMPAQVPNVTYPVHGRGSIPLGATLTWDRWTAPGAGGGVLYSLENAGTGAILYEQPNAAGSTQQWTPTGLLTADTDYAFDVDFHNTATSTQGTVNITAASHIRSGVWFSTGVVGSVTKVQLERSDDRGSPSPGDEEHGYALAVTGVALSGLQATTPWGEAFDIATYLPPGWAGESFETYDAANAIAIEAYTQSGARWFEVGWEALSAPEWASLDTASTALSVAYARGSWSGSTSFTGAPVPTQVPNVTCPVDGQSEVSLSAPFQWDLWTSPSPGATVGYSLENTDTSQGVYDKHDASAITTSWAHTGLLSAGTNYELDVDFHNRASRTVNGVPIALLSTTETDVAFTTVPPGVSEIRMERGDDRGNPTPGDEEFDYAVQVGGIELTRLQLTTPWGENFSTADYLPPGWSGQTFSTYDAANNIEIKAYTTGYERWFEVMFGSLTAPEGAALDTNPTNLTVSYTGSSWSGAATFAAAPMPTQLPNITSPTHGQSDAPLGTTLQWDPWASPQPDGGVWFRLEDADTGDPLHEELNAAPSTAAYDPAGLLEARGNYDFGVEFHNVGSQEVSGVPVALRSSLAAGIEFTTRGQVIVLDPLHTSATFSDASGDLVTVTIGKVGQVTLVRDSAPDPGGVYNNRGRGDLWTIQATGTDAKGGSIAVAVKATTTGVLPATSVGDIVVNGSLKSLSAPLMSLRGDLTITGSVAAVALDDVADSHTLRVGTDLAIAASSWTLDRVKDASLTSLTPLKSLSVCEWLDADGTPDAVVTPWISSLATRGVKGNAAVPGNFEADLTLSGVGAAKGTLAKAAILGSLRGATWNLTGNVSALASLTVARWMEDAHIFANGPVGKVAVGGMHSSSLFAGVIGTTLPDASNDFAAAHYGIASLGITGILQGGVLGDSFIDSDVAAWLIAKAAIKQVVTDNSAHGSRQFGFAAVTFSSLAWQQGATAHAWPATWPANPVVHFLVRDFV